MTEEEFLLSLNNLILEGKRFGIVLGVTPMYGSSAYYAIGIGRVNFIRDQGFVLNGVNHEQNEQGDITIRSPE